MDQARRYLVAYDIGDDQRRTRIAKVLESYGDRVQYSVFVVESRPAKLLRLRSRLEDLVVDGDSVLIADLGIVLSGAGQRLEYIGRERATTPRSAIVV